MAGCDDAGHHPGERFLGLSRFRTPTDGNPVERGIDGGRISGRLRRRLEGREGDLLDAQLEHRYPGGGSPVPALRNVPKQQLDRCAEEMRGVALEGRHGQRRFLHAVRETHKRPEASASRLGGPLQADDPDPAESCATLPGRQSLRHVMSTVDTAMLPESGGIDLSPKELAVGVLES
jgi:hypothetical protein